MKNLFKTLLVISLITGSASAQSNKIVFGPLEGDSAGVLTVHYGEDIEIEMWIRTDPDNPASIVAVGHALLSEDAIIAVRNGVILDPIFDEPNWEQVFLDTFVHDPDDHFPIPEGHTCEVLTAIWGFPNRPVESPFNTFGEWVYYGSFLMTCATGVQVDETYYPLSGGWLPHSGQGTIWAFPAPPGGGVVPEQDYCGLYFDEIIVCNYIPGDCNHNGVPLELDDIMAVYSTYRGIAEPYYICDCNADPPGPDFAATGDPNGNCISNELGDVVAEISAYRGLAEVSGCPDCPGSGGLAIGESESR
jgi:hypothetical protein